MKKILFVMILSLSICGCQNSNQIQSDLRQKDSEKPKETLYESETPNEQAKLQMDFEKAQKKIETYNEGCFQYHYRMTGDDIWITEIIPIPNQSIEILNIPTEIDGKKL